MSKAYEGKTLSQWARELGLSHEAIRKRVGRLGSLEEAVAIGPNKRPRATHVGKTIAEWAHELGISAAALYHRIARLGSLESAVALGWRNKPGRKAKEGGDENVGIAMVGVFAGCGRPRGFGNCIRLLVDPMARCVVVVFVHSGCSSSAVSG